MTCLRLQYWLQQHNSPLAILGFKLAHVGTLATAESQVAFPRYVHVRLRFRPRWRTMRIPCKLAVPSSAFTKMTCSQSACRRKGKHVHRMERAGKFSRRLHRGQVESGKCPAMTTAWSAKQCLSVVCPGRACPRARARCQLALAW